MIRMFKKQVQNKNYFLIYIFLRDRAKNAFLAAVFEVMFIYIQWNVIENVI